jgi:hypothetical protein
LPSREIGCRSRCLLLSFQTLQIHPTSQSALRRRNDRRKKPTCFKNSKLVTASECLALFECDASRHVNVEKVQFTMDLPETARSVVYCRRIVELVRPRVTFWDGAYGQDRHQYQLELSHSVVSHGGAPPIIQTPASLATELSIRTDSLSVFSTSYAFELSKSIFSAYCGKKSTP